MLKNKKGQLITGLIGGIIGLVILVIVSFVIMNTLTTSGLLASGSAGENVVNGMIANYSVGVNNISSKLPTILLIAAVVLLFGAIVFLVQRARQTTTVSSGVL